MKNVLGFLLCLTPIFHTAAQTGVPSSDPNSGTEPSSGYAITERGPHHRVWQTMKVDESGQTNFSSYTELATGLNFLNPDTGQYEESNPAFEITKDGFAIARRGQHQVVLAPNLNAAEGVVDFQTPAGQRMRSGIIGLNLFDPVSGKSLQIASVTN